MKTCFWISLWCDEQWSGYFNFTLHQNKQFNDRHADGSVSDLLPLITSRLSHSAVCVMRFQQCLIHDNKQLIIQYIDVAPLCHRHTRLVDLHVYVDIKPEEERLFVWWRRCRGDVGAGALLFKESIRGSSTHSVLLLHLTFLLGSATRSHAPGFTFTRHIYIYIYK